MNLGGVMALSVVVGLVDKLSGPARKVVDATRGVDRALNVASKMRSVGKSLIAGGGIAAGAGVAAIGQLKGLMGASYEAEQALAAVGTVASGTFGSVEKDMAAVKSASKAWASAHTDSVTAYTNASYLMVSAGLDTRQALAGTETALTVAKATMGDATEAASLLATVYNTLGDRTAPVTQEMTRLGDVVTRTQQYFKIANLGQLSAGLAYAIPQSKALGVSLEQTSAVLGQLNTLGLEGSMAGTAYSAMLRQMLKASKELGIGLVRTSSGGIDVIATVEKMRAQFGTFAEMSDAMKLKMQAAFGDEGSAALKILLGATGDLRKGLGEVTNSTGAAARAQKMMEATGGAAWENLRNHVDLMKMALGEQLGPVLLKVVDAVKWAVDGFKGFAEAHPGLAKAASWIAVVLAGLLAVGGALAVAFGSILWTFSLPITALAKLKQGLNLLRGDGIGPLAKAAKSMGGIFARSWGAIVRVVSAAVPVVSMIASAIGGILWSAIVSVTTAVWSFTVALLANPLTWIVVGIAAVIAAIVALVYYWDVVKSAVVDAAAAIWSTVTGVFGAIWGWVSGFGARMFDAGANLFSAFIDGVKSMASAVWSSVESVFGWVAKLLPHSDAKEGPLSALTGSGRSFGHTWAKGIRAGIPAIRSAVVGATAAAAIAISPVELPKASGIAEYVASSVRAPEVSSMGTVLASDRRAAATSGQAARPIQIGKLSVTVEGADVQQREQFVKMIKSLADQHG